MISHDEVEARLKILEHLQLEVGEPHAYHICSMLDGDTFDALIEAICAASRRAYWNGWEHSKQVAQSYLHARETHLSQIKCNRHRSCQRNAIVLCTKCERPLCDRHLADPCLCGCIERIALDGAQMGRFIDAEREGGKR